jgi:hypothetical protein
MAKRRECEGNGMQNARRSEPGALVERGPSHSIIPPDPSSDHDGIPEEDALHEPHIKVCTVHLHHPHHLVLAVPVART